MIDTSTSPILFFDGVCNLCNGLVQFIIRHDKKNIFLFASLQSPRGVRATATVTNSHKAPPDSVILFYKGVWYTRSSAALHVLKLLGWPWAMLFAGIIFPLWLRDGVYNLISRNRYKWFGKRDSCMIPTAALAVRFLSE